MGMTNAHNTFFIVVKEFILKNRTFKFFTIFAKNLHLIDVVCLCQTSDFVSTTIP